MTTTQEYIEWWYIPYSVEHNIHNPELAGLLDYLDRGIWWTIELNINEDDENEFEITIHQKYASMKIVLFGEELEIMYDYPISNFASYFEPFQYMDKDLFFLTYKTLLPVISDLYSK